MSKHGRYQTSHLIEDQYEPGSGKRVLKNLLGIKLKREMDEAETLALQKATDQVMEVYSRGHKFNAKDIRIIHELWLGEIYEWAGEYRNVNISKGDFTFAAAGRIPQLMEAFAREQLRKHTPCIFRTMKRIVRALSEVHVELVLIHPFREGNGRLARLISTLMAAQAGLPVLDFTDITGRRKKNYFAAVRSGLDRNYRPMEELFDRIIDRSLNG
ncbi:MAG: hypothetical protein AMK70_16480 [Nitrospira bacterium SG8_35_1]|nr:MAG: hypothetical protein AMK70_16480 [Nitrospira bacterium SG8_35_1]